MTQQELQFIDSIKNKIKNFNIRTDIKQCLKNSSNQFFQTIYNDKTTELVDAGIEYFLCRKSSSYFISKYTFIEIAGQGKYPTHLYFFQKKILETIEDYNKIVYQKSRQTGLSTVNSLYCLWLSLFYPSEWIVIISKDAKSSQEFLGKIKANLDTIPLFTNVTIKTNNVKSLEFSNGSKLDAYARSPTAGRGTSPSLVVLDECAFFSSNRIISGIVSSVTAALTKTGGKMVIISTPNGSVPDSEGYWYYTQVKDLEEAGGETPDHTARLFSIDWWAVPDDPSILPHKGYNKELKEFERKNYFDNKEVYYEAKRFFLPIQNNWKINDWLRHQYQTLKDVLYRQEILRDFVIMGNSVFSTELMDKVRNRLKEPKSKDTLGGRPFKDLWVWKEPEPKKRYILGADVASGTSNDFSSIEVIDVENYEQVAEYIGKCTVQDLAINIRKLGTYYNSGYAIVESNSIGEAVFSNLYYCDDGYNNLFKQQKNSNGVTRYTGWITTSKSRQLITNNFIDYFYVDELFEVLKVYSERLLGQMLTWVNTQRGADHLAGSHDDAIMAFAIALFNRSKAVDTGASFLIDEQGKTVSYADSGNRQIEEIKGLAPISSGQRDKIEEIEDSIEEMYGVPDLASYRWILG